MPLVPPVGDHHVESPPSRNGRASLRPSPEHHQHVRAATVLERRHRAPEPAEVPSSSTTRAFGTPHPRAAARGEQDSFD